MFIVLAAHLALLLGWNTLQTPRRTPANNVPEAWTWLLLPATPPAATPAPAASPSPAAMARRVPTQPALRAPADHAPPRVPLRPPDPPVPGEDATEPPPGPNPGVAAAPAAPGTAASGPTGGTLMTGDATRRAIREAARQPLLSERAAQATGQPFRRGAERLADAASAAGKGDCLKGEYAGGGMGLLSLPFLAVAAARGDCAH